MEKKENRKIRKNKVTEIVFILDRSGSMGGLESDTIGGFNSFIEKQCQMEGETIVTTVLFDDRYEILWNGVDGEKAKLTEKEYYVRGTTALFDAVGKTILDVRRRLKTAKKKEEPEKVIMVITTDGMENASREFSMEKVRKLVEQQTKEGWEFLFLGASLDSAREARDMGISKEDVHQFVASDAGVKEMYTVLSRAVSDKRSEGKGKK